MKIKRSIIQLSLAWILCCCGSNDQTKMYDNEIHTKSTAVLNGKELSLKYCQSCHLYPDASVLDKHTWQRSVLPLMGRRFGIYEKEVPRSKVLAGAIDRDLVLQYNIFPELPIIDEESWQKIIDYYVSSAPESTRTIKINNPVLAPLKIFEVIIPRYKTKTPLTTLVQIDGKTSQVYVGGSKGNAGSLTILNKDFKIIQEIKLPAPPVDLSVSIDTLALTLVGPLILSPSNNPRGRLLHIFRGPGETKYTLFNSFLDNLKRPLQTIFEDIDADGLDDLLIADFGYYTGAVNLYRHAEGKKGSFEKSVLKNVSGAIRMYVNDINKDGHKDVAVLFAQGDEGISFFINDGNGEFKERRVLRFNPAYGSVYFELVDINEDGHLDILYCNGDNGDYPPVLKDYHGIRIFQNDGNNDFKEVYFYQMDGAYKCSATDFDLDGDMDIVAISYFPDPEATPRRDFVYLKNLGNYSFFAESLQQNIPARWVTLDIADLDGNGYPDIVLGAAGTKISSSSQDRNLSDTGPSLVFLKNVGTK